MINKQQFENLVKASDKLDLSTIPMLDKLLSEFPYCQTIHLLYLKNLKKEKNIHYRNQLKIAAAYASDRRVLREFMMDTEDGVEKKNVTVKKEEKPAEKIVKETPVVEKIKNSSPTKEEKNIEEKATVTHKNNLSAVIEEGNFDGEVEVKTGYPYAGDDEVLPLHNGENLEKENKRAKRREKIEEIKRELELLQIEKDRVEELISEEAKLKQRKQKEKENSLFEKKIDKKFSYSDFSVVVDEKIENKEKVTGNNTKDLINNFLREEPTITRRSKVFFDVSDVAKESVVQNNDIVTETLAKILLKQGKVLQAIKIYEKLSLKYPKKSGYFAHQISEIKKL
ncbi:MAG: hypothetical protein U9R32_00325 [Bacteroidota bacterium]|nr:hypothetical protein [Bacteroidota bacterium]